MAVKLKGVTASTKPFERAVFEAVPDGAAGRDGLLAVEAVREGDVEAQEVDELAGAVDLGLEGVLRLPEHRRRVDRRAPRPGEQVGGAQEDGGALVERHPRPVVRGGAGGSSMARSTSGVPHRWPMPSNRACSCGARTSTRASGLDALAADDGGNLDRPLGLHRVEALFQRGPLGAAGRVAEHGFVDGDGRGGDGVEHRANGRRRTGRGGWKRFGAKIPVRGRVGRGAGLPYGRRRRPPSAGR